MFSKQCVKIYSKLKIYCGKSEGECEGEVQNVSYKVVTSLESELERMGHMLKA